MHVASRKVTMSLSRRLPLQRSGALLLYTSESRVGKEDDLTASSDFVVWRG